MSQGRRFARSGRVPPFVVPAVVVLALVLAGITVLALHPWRSKAGANGQQPPSVRTLNLPGGPEAPALPPAAPTVKLPPAAARSASAAVATYLRARSQGHARTSYALLAPSARRTYPSEATWLDALPDLPAPKTFTITGDKAAGSGMDVSVDVRRTPILNSFVGFVPGHATEVYRAVPSKAGWRVDAEPVSVTPKLVSDRTAAADVTAWLERVSTCDGAGAVALQVSSELLGDPSLAGAICTKHAQLHAAPAQPMVGDPSTAPFLSAYGPDIGSWARLVPVTGPNQQLLVGVAPLGGSWRVFGIVSGGVS